MVFLLAWAHAACTFDATLEQLSRNLDAAEAAYVSLDVPGFQRAMTEVDYLVPCLVEPATPALAAHLHRVRGIGSFVDGKPDASRAAFQAARALEPDYVFPEEVLPPGFELRLLYEGLPTDVLPGPRMPRPRAASLAIDGRPTTARPTEAAALFQVVGDDGNAQSRYLLPEDPLPDYPGVDRRRTTWLASGLATTAASALLYGAAWSSRARLQEATDLDALDQGTTRTHVLLGASTVLFVAGGGQLGLAAFGGRR